MYIYDYSSIQAEIFVQLFTKWKCVCMFKYYLIMTHYQATSADLKISQTKLRERLKDMETEKLPCPDKPRGSTAMVTHPTDTKLKKHSNGHKKHSSFNII